MSKESINCFDICPALMQMDSYPLRRQSIYQLEFDELQDGDSWTCTIGESYDEAQFEKKEEEEEAGRKQQSLEESLDHSLGLNTEVYESHDDGDYDPNFTAPASLGVYTSMRNNQDYISCSGCPLLPKGFDIRINSLKNETNEKEMIRRALAKTTIAKQLKAKYGLKDSISAITKSVESVFNAINNRSRIDMSYEDLQSEYLELAEDASKRNPSEAKRIALNGDTINLAGKLGDLMAWNGEDARIMRLQTLYQDLKEQSA